MKRLEEIAKITGRPLVGPKCKAMEGLIEGGSELINEGVEESVKDAGLIGVAQRVEHYEIAGYGTACVLAIRLGHDDVADLLTETLEEEKETNNKLTELTEVVVNDDAAEAGA